MKRRISHYSLQVSSPQQSLEFYCHRLGMNIIGHTEGEGDRPSRYLLSFGANDLTALELLYGNEEPRSLYQHDEGDLYWKTGITLPDVDNACERLRHHGVEVTDPHQFRDIGYLCHLADPDGYVIELLQHKFEENHTPGAADPALALGAPPTLGQITIRVTHIERSLGFYRDFLGMELLSRQEVAPSEFTLYFLAYTDEAPPRTDLDAVENREWLWQRPYTTIELQHVWGRDRGDFSYRTEESSPLGFRGITIAAEDRTDFRREARKAGVDIETVPRRTGPQGRPHLTMCDPDGTVIHIVDPT